ncbi:hypothetical protein AB0M29_24640 [Streptomyces sp. NPDC051976]
MASGYRSGDGARTEDRSPVRAPPYRCAYCFRGYYRGCFRTGDKR